MNGTLSYYENIIFKRYSNGKQLEADESTHLLFVPVRVIEEWDLTKFNSNETSVDQVVEGRRSENATFQKIYSEMTGGCQGGLRLLHLHINHEKSRYKLLD